MDTLKNFEQPAPGTKLGELYRKLYDLLCGRHPVRRQWHFQWLNTRGLYRELRRIAPEIQGTMLDVGCGNKPYERWFGHVSKYVGLDTSPGDAVDVLVFPGAAWPFPDAHFDAVLSTQVLMYMPDLREGCREIERVLKPGGTAIVSIGFIFQEHHPCDRYRVSAIGGGELFPNMEVLKVCRLGGIGSTLGVLGLNWLNEGVDSHLVLKAGRALLLPFWLMGTALVNALALLLDALDRTGHYYANVLLVLRKHGSSQRVCITGPLQV
jgi:SAM-dependent methyltransferase